MNFIKSFIKEKWFNIIYNHLDFKKSYTKKISRIIDTGTLDEKENSILYNLVLNFCTSVAHTDNINYWSAQCFLDSLHYYNHNSSQNLSKILSLDFYYKIHNLFHFEIHLIKLQLKLIK